MKFFVFLLLTIGLWSCIGEEMDMQQAKITAETAMNLIGNEQFDKLDSFYSQSFGISEPIEERNKKFALIIDATGSVKSFELIDSIAKNVIGEERRVTLTYKVAHTNMTTFETYKIGLEGGKYVISGIDIQMNN